MINVAQQSIEAGTLRFAATIQQRADNRDATGQAIPTWSTFANTRADRTPLSGVKLIEAQKIDANAADLLVMRYRAGVVPKMRVVIQGSTLEIVSVTNRGGLNIALDLACAEVKS